RERQDMARVECIVDLAEHEGCLTQFVLRYFGEQRGACAHCSRCEGAPAQPLRNSQDIAAIDTDLIHRLKQECHDALSSPRQIARFLCGISSPATTRHRLRARPEFATMARIPFEAVLRAIEAP